ncbi:MAG: ATP-binding cassette domain-containing protein [Bradyrhizobium sp.]|jgi:branched-chain amino acid transport system ATP-binding protein
MELVRTENLYLAFGAIVVADNINFSLQEGERLAVIGANGAGKTTFINIVTGYLRARSGRIFFSGTDVTKMPPRGIVHLGLGRSFQLPQLFLEHTVRQCLELAAVGRIGSLPLLKPLSASVDQSEIDHTLEVTGLATRGEEMASALGEGERKLLDVAMALVLRPKLLIMDEPTSGVASEEKHGIMETIMGALAERKVTSWFVEHDVDVVTRHATRVAAWISGRIAADGKPEQVFAEPEIRRQVLGTH